MIVRITSLHLSYLFKGGVIPLQFCTLAMFFPISLCGDLLKIFSDSRFICRILGGGNRGDSRADLTSGNVFFFTFLSVCLLGLFEREKTLIAGSFVGSLEVETGAIPGQI